MRVVRGAFEDKSMLDKLGANLIEKYLKKITLPAYFKNGD